MELYQDQMKGYQFNIETHRKHHKQKDGKSPYTYYNNSILTFDIEVTSAFIDNKGKVIPYKKGKKNEYWNDKQALALCYIWQFSCDGKVYYGRELKDFVKVLDALPTHAKSIIWVHNLSYEFAFLYNILEWGSVFARTSHKPIKAIPKEYPNIEFRCSYMLTRLSLETWGNQLGVYKAVGDLDYEKIRTPLTPLTEQEMHYCEQDCLVVEAGIKEYIKRYGKQRDIPLTQTGTVRREVKDRLFKNPRYTSYIKKLVPKNADEYKLLQTIFAGGYTHANRKWAGLVIEDLVQHYDFASSYPTVMIAEKYPVTPWAEYPVWLGFPKESTYENKAYLLCVEFEDLKCISDNTYIQEAKATNKKNVKKDNGRVLSADTLTMWFTEQDWITVSHNYTWKTAKLIKAYSSYKGYLPKELLEYILELYSNKTSLKDVEGMEDIYMQAKQYINSLFGMSVTALIQAEVIQDHGEWSSVKLTKFRVNEYLDKLRKPLKGDKKYFMNYSWGIYVTAYARRNLWKCIESCDHDVIYCDTDSIFVLGKHDFSWYNEEITEKLRVSCEENGLDFESTRPKTKEGKPKPLGIFDREDDCIQFITLGAKRYVERRKKDKKLHLTVSGINKGAVELLNDNIYNFKDKFEFDKDADCVTKRLCTYLTDMPSIRYPDGYMSTYKYGINLRRTGYKLTITPEYQELIDYILHREWDDHAQNVFNAQWEDDEF